MLVEKDLSIHNLTVERDAARAELKKTREHTEQYRAIATATEASLAEVRARARAREAEVAASLEASKRELEGLRADYERKSQALNDELASTEKPERARARGRARRAGARAASAAAGERDALRAQLGDAAAREATLGADVATQREAAESARASYERELQQHAATVARLSESDAEREALRGARSELEAKLSGATADLLQAETTAKAARAGLEKAADDATARARDLEAQNALLHSQLGALSAQVEKMHEQRVSAAVDGGGADAAGAGAAGADGAAAAAEAGGARRRAARTRTRARPRSSGARSTSFATSCATCGARRRWPRRSTRCRSATRRATSRACSRRSARSTRRAPSCARARSATPSARRARRARSSTSR